MATNVLSRQDESGAEIVVLRPAMSEGAATGAHPLLSPAERQRAARFVRDTDRFRYLEVCARLRLLLASRLDIPADRVDIVTGSHGKPALAPGSPVDLRFNTSHTDGLAAFAFAVGREVGIDIEAIRPSPDLDTVAAHVLSEAE